MQNRISRREFLVYSTFVSSSLTIGFINPSKALQVENLLDAGNPLMIPTNFEPTAIFTMEPSGRTTIHVNKC